LAFSQLMLGLQGNIDSQKFLQVIQKLRTLFNGYSEMPPTCFVLCGHFTTQPYGTEHVRILKGMLDICCIPDWRLDVERMQLLKLLVAVAYSW